MFVKSDLKCSMFFGNILSKRVCKISGLMVVLVTKKRPRNKTVTHKVATCGKVIKRKLTEN